MRGTARTMEDLKSGGARGGAAARGEKKRRSMKGVPVGRGSAGRSDSGPSRAKEHERMGGVMGAYFPDVARACSAWLRARGIEKVFSEQMR